MHKENSSIYRKIINNSKEISLQFVEEIELGP